MANQFPDGQLSVNLRGFDPSGQTMDPAVAIRRFLDALGMQPQRIPADLDTQAALYRSQLASKRMLVVLDSARDTAQVCPLLPGGLVLVTSRNQLSGLIATDGAPHHPGPAHHGGGTEAQGAACEGPASRPTKVLSLI